MVGNKKLILANIAENIRGHLKIWEACDRYLEAHVRCRHEYAITGTPTTGICGLCRKCGMRTPVYPWENGAWAKDLFKRAEREGTLYKDESVVRK